MYLSYDEYINLGGECDNAAFNRQIMRVCGIVSNATHGRIDKDVPEQAKGLCRDLVDYFNCHKIGVSSESQSSGGVSESVSYVTQEQAQDDIDRLIFEYLGSVRVNNVPVLYRGAK
jgi:hypothetical protein